MDGLKLSIVRDKPRGGCYLLIPAKLHELFGKSDICLNFRNVPEYIILKPAGIDDSDRIKMTPNNGSYRAYIGSKRYDNEPVIGHYTVDTEEDGTFTLNKV